ncbi:helix-turn-helix domain-containing protein [Novosphingobium sp. 17-62-19]|uniref:helix-turn-helix domain-containing protein n=1 Tax=Novosphingobium sp. 17-62-19 TaxID=1970406 RepID=UPI0025EB9C22|nr:helix-turn-helix domain-containing protein [Novosphingobium sp. 17-62-19]HQS98435.1 helix-turn-helix domain-containing protein [Novosphingobium sp.]
MTGDCTVRVRFHRPPAPLAPYFTTFYITEVVVADGGRVTDHLHPEWANVRIFSGDCPDSELPGQAPLTGSAANFTGPTSTALKFTVGTLRTWGVGILPLGWARFVGQPANAHADRVYALAEQPFLQPFAPLAAIFGQAPDEEAELSRITQFFLQKLAQSDEADDPRILVCHNALLDPEISNVAEMAEATRLPAHTLERQCRRHFGFAPRLLLRRQRFMRSLVQYMLDPTLHWIGAIDSHYHDQAQFVRDFHRFMGMSPREYAATPKPILQEVMRARQEFLGSAVQALHAPVPR